jgi:hypothetical protein
MRTSVAWAYREEFGDDNLFYITKEDHHSLLVRHVTADIGSASHGEIITYLSQVRDLIAQQNVKTMKFPDRVVNRFALPDPTPEDKVERWISCRNIRTGNPASALQLSEADIEKAREILGMPELKAGDYMVKYEDHSLRVYREDRFYHAYYRGR